MLLKILVAINYQSNPPIRFTAIYDTAICLLSFNVSQMLTFSFQQFTPQKIRMEMSFKSSRARNDQTISLRRIISALLYIYRLFQVQFFLPRTIPLLNRLPPAAAEALPWIFLEGAVRTYLIPSHE